MASCESQLKLDLICIGSSRLRERNWQVSTLLARLMLQVAGSGLRAAVLAVAAADGLRQRTAAPDTTGQLAAGRACRALVAAVALHSRYYGSRLAEPLDAL